MDFCHPMTYDAAALHAGSSTFVLMIGTVDVMVYIPPTCAESKARQAARRWIRK